MGNMEENNEVLQSKINPSANDLLMKPFSLGWTREVVMRVITKSGAPNCDIYYFSPSKKKIRSLNQLKSLLTDGLSPECFSFKKKPLGLSPNLETIRRAQVRGKKFKKNKEKKQSALKNSTKHTTLTEINHDNECCIKKPKKETQNEVLEEEKLKSEDNLRMPDNIRTEESAENLENHSDETQTTKINHEKFSKQNNNFNNKKKSKRKLSNSMAPVKSLRLRKNLLKKMMSAKQAKQANAVARKKILNKIVLKLVKSPNQKLSKKRNRKETELNKTKNKKLKLKSGNKLLKNSVAKTKKGAVKEAENNETDKKCATRDLKSIVKKNIGKYRELREKQKLKAIKSQVESSIRRASSASQAKTRSEPISKNKPLYLKPLEKGWKRELVYRTNCARSGQMADVYYFHPNGKKLRSSREVSENLTHGLSIECFTFRKEAIGCGEPFEVVRNAKFIHKN